MGPRDQRQDHVHRVPRLPGVNTPHVVHYDDWHQRFLIHPSHAAYVDSFDVVHEVKSVTVVTDLFGVPKDGRATIVLRCGGGPNVPLARLRMTGSVNCWECLSR